MSFLSIKYLLLFLPICIILDKLNQKYYLQNKNLALCLLSYLFYSANNLYLVFVLFFSSSIDFHLAKELVKSKNPKIYVAISIFINISLLTLFKIIGNSEGSPHFFQTNGLNIPPGISFYTFQTISYVVDCYRRRINPCDNVIDYFTFVAFFPQLVAGPIEKAGKLINNLDNRLNVDCSTVMNSIILIAIGITKKIAFADNLHHLNQYQIENLDRPFAGFVIGFSVLMQLTFDFSSYTDIARGSARLFGIELTKNFHAPFYCKNPKDLWNRWHISMTTFAKDYILKPILNTQKGYWTLLFARILTTCLLGIWHGLNYNFLLWGLGNGLIIIFYHYCPLDKYVTNIFGKFIGTIIAIFFMYMFTIINLQFFFLQDIQQIKISFLSMLHLPTSFSEPRLIWYVLVYSLPVILFEFWIYITDRPLDDLIASSNTFIRTSILITCFYLSIFLKHHAEIQYIYFNF